jgi:hypothetical protein
VEHLARQEALIAELERDGHHTKLAKEPLATLRKTQFLHLEDRERLLEELRALDGSGLFPASGPS